MKRIFFLMAALVLLSGCTELEFASHIAKRNMAHGKTPVQEGNFKIGKPYAIDGKWYYPKEEYDFTETGIASWYGPGFHGKRTANGEIFDKNELTAAHRTLQMPSLVRVTNLSNGRSVIVRVNDRGPYKRGRVMDVSEKAAELLGFKGHGTAKIKLQVLKEESLRIAEAARSGVDTRGYELASYQPPAAPVESVARETLVTPGTQPGIKNAIPGHTTGGQFYPDPIVTEMPITPSNIYVQAGSFSVYDNALAQRDRLLSFSKAEVYPVNVGGKPLFRVRLGPVGNVEEADELLARMVQNGYKDTIIVVD